MSSRYEKNIFLQPALIRDILRAPRPGWMEELKGRRVHFVGIGTSYFAAQVANWLWRLRVSRRSTAVHSFDFVRVPQDVPPEDVVVIFSHRGTKSFSVEAAALARKAGAVVVGITGTDSPWKESLAHRLDTGEAEDTGAFTKSVTSALTWIVRWIGDRDLAEGAQAACASLAQGPAFPEVSAETDLVFLGDAVREWVGREIALKTQETAYLPARAFGLEEFLHGPRVSVGARSLVVAFSAPAESRWESVRQYLRAVRVPLLEVPADGIVPCREIGWLWQLFWGQRFALEICRRLGIDPDALRTTDAAYREARERLLL